MSRATISIGPNDRGRRMALDEFATAEAAEGHLYELGRGAVVVVDVPGRGHLAALGALKRQIHGFDAENPGIIHTIASGGECKILVADLDSERHPDLAICKTPPGVDDDFWSTWIPEVVVEVVSRGSIHRDYVEKREEYLRFEIKEYGIIDGFRQQILILRRYRGRWTERVLDPTDFHRTRLLPGFELACGPILRAGLEG